MSARRTQLVVAPLVAGLLAAASGCVTEIESAARPTDTAIDTASVDSADSTSTSSATTTSSPVPATESSTTSDSTISDSTSSTVAATTAPSTTAAAPVVGQFECTPAGQEPVTWEVRPPSDIPSPEMPPGWTRAVVGRSVQGRGIEALVRSVEGPRRRVLVIGGVHGNEPVTVPVVRGLLDAEVPDDVEVWLVPAANPDGSTAGLRCNANGVDLNRNFAWEWSADDGGPAAMSEPETQTLATLVEQLQPDVVVWMHQPLGYVSAIGTTGDALEQAWSAAAGIPVRPDVTQHGGGESWSALVAGAPTLLIEIDGWEAAPDVVTRNVAGFEAMLAALG